MTRDHRSDVDPHLPATTPPTPRSFPSGGPPGTGTNYIEPLEPWPMDPSPEQDDSLPEPDFDEVGAE